MSISKQFLLSLLVALTSFVFVSNSFAQVQFQERIEFDSKSDVHFYNHFTFGEDGLVVTLLTEGKYIFEKYNTSLQKVKTAEYEIGEKRYPGFRTTDDAVYMLLMNKKTGEAEMTRIDAETLSMKTVKATFPKKVYVTRWNIIGDYAVMLVKKKKEMYISKMNLKTGEITSVFPNTHIRNKFTYNGLDILRGDNPELQMIFEERIDKITYKYHIYRFNTLGELIGGKPLAFDNSKEPYIISFALTKEQGGQGYLISGTYSDRNRSTSKGILFGKLSNAGKLSSVTTMNYLEIKDFLTYLPEKKQERIERKKERKETKGKELSYNYFCAIHDISQVEDRYYFIGEFYYPTYRTETYTTYVNGQAVTRTRRVFDGYQYSHAIVACFDLEGKMLWNETFEMWVVRKPFYVKRFIEDSYENGQAKLLFATGSWIRSKTYDANGAEVHQREVSLQETGEDEEQIKYTAAADIDFWYGDTFLTSGFQKIKDPTKDTKKDKKKRKVHFLGKISY